MTELDFETSQLQLLTDALRAGPGSPEWRAAMEAAELPASGVAAQEYKLLDAAPGSTPATSPAANVIAAVSALVILGVLAFVAWLIIPRGETTPGPGSDL